MDDMIRNEINVILKSKDFYEKHRIKSPIVFEKKFKNNPTLRRDVLATCKLSNNFLRFFASYFTPNNWYCINKSQKLSEDFVREFHSKLSWKSLSCYQKFSENFIREFSNEVDWDGVCENQKLSEGFIIEFYEKVNWSLVSQYQKLSENFIRTYKDKVCWYNVSYHQKLSEDFISEFQDKVNWDYLLRTHKLSENFMEKHEKYMIWEEISKYQKLSEKFIEKYRHRLDWVYIVNYQDLSDNFIKKYKKINFIKYMFFHYLTCSKLRSRLPEISCYNWKNFSLIRKKSLLLNTDLYEVIGNKIIAYKGIRSDNYSKYNFQYKYEVGQTYEAHCDCDEFTGNSFGLSAWTLEKAKEYCGEKIIKVEIDINDLGCLTINDKKIRCRKLKVIEVVEGE